jgi:hypothetical protein
MRHTLMGTCGMSVHPFIADLDFAVAANLRVTLYLRNGQTLTYLEVKEVDHPNFQVVVATPRTFADKSSRTRLNIGDFVGVQVTEVAV